MAKYNNNNTDKNDGCEEASNGRSYAQRSSKSKSRRNSNSRNSRNGNRSRSSIDTKSLQDKDGRISNDPNWYFLDAELAKQASAVSFNQFLGAPFDLSDKIVASMKVPTFARIELMPSPGSIPANFAMGAGINMQGMKLYTSLSSNNAKTTGYAPQDVTTLLLAFGNLLESVSYLRRMFGVAFSYNQRNRFYPKQVLGALGVDPDTFLRDLATNRLDFNTTINTINKIPIPANIAYFAKCATLYDGIFLDSETTMAQSYALAPRTYWMFDEAYSEEGTGLRTGTWPSAPTAQWSDLIAVINGQVEALLTSSTFNYIYSDILNYCTKNNVSVYANPIIAEDYAIAPIYSPEMLLQINNMRILGIPQTTVPTGINGCTPSNDVVPDVNQNCVRYNPVFRKVGNGVACDPILNFNTPTPDTAQIIEATRYTYIADDVQTSESVQYLTDVALGDHYVASLAIYSDSDVNDMMVTSSAWKNPSAKYLAMLDKFDYAPRFELTDDSDEFVGILGDLDYFTSVDTLYLMRVNDLTMQGLFEIGRAHV